MCNYSSDLSNSASEGGRSTPIALLQNVLRPFCCCRAIELGYSLYTYYSQRWSLDLLQLVLAVFFLPSNSTNASRAAHGGHHLRLALLVCVLCQAGIYYNVHIQCWLYVVLLILCVVLCVAMYTCVFSHICIDGCMVACKHACLCLLCSSIHIGLVIVYQFTNLR